MSDDKYLFNIKTVQTGAIRILIESLKEILNDALKSSKYEIYK